MKCVSILAISSALTMFSGSVWASENRDLSDNEVVVVLQENELTANTVSHSNNDLILKYERFDLDHLTAGEGQESSDNPIFRCLNVVESPLVATTCIIVVGGVAIAALVLAGGSVG